MPQNISSQLTNKILTKIHQEGPLSFYNFMQMALYEPGLGYYSAGSIKLGPAGDFITAPELSPLFAQCVGLQCLEILTALSSINKFTADILELGAGSGKLAAGILSFLAAKDALPNTYYILEVSADLRSRQQEYLAMNCPNYLSNIVWLDSLPEEFTGIILANEVLDAMPIHKFKALDKSTFLEYYVTKSLDVTSSEQPLTLTLQPISNPDLITALTTLQADLSPNYLENYTSEINLSIEPFIAALGDILVNGAIFFFDYGFPRSEYYHPDRAEGTLMAHYQHKAHSNPLINIGLQDLTAHVNFSLVAEAGFNACLRISGYTEQSSFLLANSLMEFADEYRAQLSEQNQLGLSSINHQVQALTMPYEMGELFKVICLSREIDFIPRGFSLSNKKFKL